MKKIELNFSKENIIYLIIASIIITFVGLSIYVSSLAEGFLILVKFILVILAGVLLWYRNSFPTLIFILIILSFIYKEDLMDLYNKYENPSIIENVVSIKDDNKALAGVKDREKKLKVEKELMELKKNELSLYSKALLNLANKDYTQAIKKYKQLVSDYPKSDYNSVYHSHIGSCYYYLGEYLTAKEYLEKALDNENLSDSVRRDMEKQLDIVNKKISDQKKKK